MQKLWEFNLSVDFRGRYRQSCWSVFFAPGYYNGEYGAAQTAHAARIQCFVSLFLSITLLNGKGVGNGVAVKQSEFKKTFWWRLIWESL